MKYVWKTYLSQGHVCEK